MAAAAANGGPQAAAAAFDNNLDRVVRPDCFYSLCLCFALKVPFI